MGGKSTSLRRGNAQKVDEYTIAGYEHNNKEKEREVREKENQGILTKTMLETMNARYRSFREVPFTERVEVRKSRIHGWGLFVVNKPIEPNEMVVEYLGEIVRPVVADIREKDYEEKGMGSCYLFRLDNDKIIDATATGNLGRFVDHSCDPNCHAQIITVTGSNCTSTMNNVNNQNGNTLSFHSGLKQGDGESNKRMNRSAKNPISYENNENNVNIGNDTSHLLTTSNANNNEETREKKIVFFALKHVAVGEELTYDYKFPIEENKLRCYCGAATCSGSMN